MPGYDERLSRRKRPRHGREQAEIQGRRGSDGRSKTETSRSRRRGNAGEIIGRYLGDGQKLGNPGRFLTQFLHKLRGHEITGCVQGRPQVRGPRGRRGRLPSCSSARIRQPCATARESGRTPCTMNSPGAQPLAAVGEQGLPLLECGIARGHAANVSPQHLRARVFELPPGAGQSGPGSLARLPGR